MILPDGALYMDDEESIRDRFWHVRPGDTVVDVGCGFGAYTLRALEAGAYVYAIDSNRKTLKVLEQAAEMNGFADLAALRMAVYNGESRIPLALKRQHHVSAMSPPRNVHWATLDGLVAGKVIARKVDWLKVDVEGVELGVLLGAVGLLAKDRPTVIVEDHTRVYEWVHRIRSTHRIATLLCEHGYRVELVPYAVEGTPERDYLIGTPWLD